VFAALIPPLSAPTSQACLDAINDPERTMLGDRQHDRFVRQVEDSGARWKVIVNETPIMQFYALPYDRWEGYAYERVRLLNDLQKRGIGNVVFLTTDTHAAFVNVVRERTLPGDAAPANASGGTPPIDTPYQDFVIGPVATNTQWAEVDDVTGGAGNGELVSDLFYKPQPPGGVGMECAQGDVYSYAEVTAAKKKLDIEFKDENGDPVVDVDGERCGPYTVEPF
jgi:phosphodiesterase/alkaline phosphatase D-like protein